jgi:dTDP-4-dehydrorhamnose reductase
MRLLVTGRNGQVAQALMDRAGQFPEINVIALGRPQLDLENPAQICSSLEEARPDVIINAAAYTAVDRAEADPQRAFAINRDGAAGVAEAARKLAVPLVHLSTDYVFSGDKETAYLESDVTGPLGVYGESKLAGELAVRAACPDAVILRTSWVYSPFGSNFVKTMLRLAGERSELRVVDDQVGNPTSALDLAEAILSIAPRINDGAGGLFHVAGDGFTSWYGLAKQVFDASRRMGGASAKVAPITTAEYPTAARRPVNSRLDSSAFKQCFGLILPDWRVGVEETVSRTISGRNRS